MNEHQPPFPSNAHSLPPPPVVSVQQMLISPDQYESFTYQKWFARQTGLSVDEAIALGLAKRVAS
jgi:hypothetical protein